MEIAEAVADAIKTKDFLSTFQVFTYANRKTAVPIKSGMAVLNWLKTTKNHKNKQKHPIKTTKAMLNLVDTL